MSEPRDGAKRTFPWMVLAPCAVFFVLLIVWHTAVQFWQLPKVLLPSPMSVLQSGWEERMVLLRGTWATGKAAMMGLLGSIALGSALAVVFSQSRWIRMAFYPYVIFLQTVPIVAIAPLLIIWMGNGFGTIVTVVMIISIFPIVANVTTGLLSIDRNWVELFELHRASRWQTLIKLRIPIATAHLVVGMRIASGLAVIGAIVGEFFVGNVTSYDGLGSLMTRWQTQLKTDLLMAAVGMSTLLGVLFFLLVNLLASTVLRRWTLALGFESAK